MDIGENLDWIGRAVLDAEMCKLCRLELVTDPKILMFDKSNSDTDAAAPPAAAMPISMVIASCCSARRHAGSCAPPDSLSIEDLSKNSRGVRAIDSVTLKVVHREVHGLLVQNVSGKSTLIQILSGSTSRIRGTG
jgi:ABC-type molybdenum transport system ATPase subunit/photorepair protein PhrA